MNLKVLTGLGLKLPKNRMDEVTIGKIEGSPFAKDKLTEAQLNHHVHVVGASGFGKTVFLSQIIKQQIANGKGLLFIDLKSDIETMNSFAQMALRLGRQNDFVNFSLGEHNISSSPYNILGTGTATQIRDRVMSSLNWSEEFYKNVSASFLLKVLMGLCCLRDRGGPQITLRNLYDLVTNRNTVRELLKQVPEEERVVAHGVREAVAFIGPDAQWNALQGLRSQLESIVLSDFGDLVASNRDGIDLFETVRDGKLVFLYLDTRRYGETAKTIGRFILQDLKAVSARIDGEVKKDERKPFSVIIDEFADLAQEDFIGFLDRARSSKMSIVVSHQEICDLQRVSPEFAGRLMGNTSSLYAFLQRRPESAELISSIAGTKKSWKETERVSQGLLFETATGEKSVREVEEFVIHPNTIKRLRVGECVVIKKYPRASAYKVRVDAN